MQTAIMGDTPRNKEQIELLDSINNSYIQQLTDLLTINSINPNTSIGYELNENNCPFKLQLPPLHICASKGNYTIASLLIKLGANVNNIDSYGTTAMHWAATAGRKKVIKLLLKHNANINQCDFLGMTALHSAAYSGRTKTVKYLLKNGANKTIKSNDNEIALDLAVSQNNINCMNVLKCQLSDIFHGRNSTRISIESVENESSNESKYRYSNTMEKYDISKIHLLESHSYSSDISTETSDGSDGSTGHLNDKLTDQRLKSMQLRNQIKSLQMETKNIKLTYKKQQTNNMKQQTVKKQMKTELKETKNKLTNLRNKQKEKQLKIDAQNIEIKQLQNEKRKIEQNLVNNSTNVNKLKKHLRHKLIVLQKMNAENYRLHKRKTEIKQKQIKRKSKSNKSKTIILNKRQLNFNKWITDIVSLPFYAVKFEKYEYNRLDIVKHLDNKELKQIGIKNYYHRAQILKQIALLKTN